MPKIELPKEVLQQFKEAGARGGDQRKKNLSPERRTEIARNAGKARAKQLKSQNAPGVSKM